MWQTDHRKGKKKLRATGLNLAPHRLVEIPHGFAIPNLTRTPFTGEKRWQPIKTRHGNLTILSLNEQLNTVTRKVEVVSSVPDISKKIS